VEGGLPTLFKAHRARICFAIAMRPEKPWERARRTSQGDTNDQDVRQTSGAAASTSQAPMPEPFWRGMDDPNANAYATGSYGGYGGGYGGVGYGSSYGGYGGFGGGGYGSNYGGYGGMQGGGYGGYGGMQGGGYGGYGGMQGGAYGGMYGRGTYGFGSAGNGPGYGYGSAPGGLPGPGDGPAGNPERPSGPAGMYQSAMRTLHSVVSFFGRISYLVDQNTIALHMFIEALLNLLDRAGWLYGELARLVLRILGFKPKERKKADDARDDGQGPPVGSQSQPSGATQGTWNEVWHSPPLRKQ